MAGPFLISGPTLRFEMSEYDLHQIEEDTAAERFCIIFRGKIEITKKFEDGEQFVLGVHSDGEFFGEMALLDEGPRSATARALESTTIMKALSSRLRETGALLISYLQRKRMSFGDAEALIKKGAGKQYDPEVVKSGDLSDPSG